MGKRRVFLALLLALSPVAPAQGAVLRVFQGGQTGASGAQAGASVRRNFIQELDFSIKNLNLMSQGLPSAEGPSRTINPDASVLYMTALSATPAAVEEHAARQVAIEYLARLSLRGEIERALDSAEEGRPVAAGLRNLRRKVEAMDKKDRRALLTGLVQLRRKLYADTGKAATLSGTRENLAAFFDARNLETSSSVSAAGAETRGRSLLKPAAAPAERRRFLSIAKEGEPRDENESAAGIVEFITRIITHYVRPIAPERLLAGVVKEAAIDGVKAGKASDADRRELNSLAGSLSRIGRRAAASQGVLSNQAVVDLVSIIRYFIRKDIARVSDPKDAARLLKNIVHQTKDPYSTFLDAEETGRFRRRMSSQFAGIGITLDPARAAGGIVIKETLEDGPAARAGLKAGDRIVGVDGQKAFTIRDVQKIMGEPGTPVRLSVRRGDELLDFDIKRAVLPEPPHVFYTMHPSGVGYLYFGAFHGDTAMQVSEALRQMDERGLRSLILDLRFNGGGRLDAANAIASRFLPKGRIIERVKKDGRIETATTQADGRYAGLPVTILVNRHSASASEVLSAALKDNGRATVIGEATYGKGVGQSPMTVFFEGLAGLAGTLYLTTLEWFTPLMRSIHGNGVQPDVRLKSDEDGYRAAAQNIRDGLRGETQWNVKNDPWILSAFDVALKKVRFRDGSE